MQTQLTSQYLSDKKNNETEDETFGPRQQGEQERVMCSPKPREWRKELISNNLFYTPDLTKQWIFKCMWICKVIATHFVDFLIF